MDSSKKSRKRKRSVSSKDESHAASADSRSKKRATFHLNETRADLVANHIKSFDALFDTSISPGVLSRIVTHLPIFEVDDPKVSTDRPVWRYRLKQVEIGGASRKSFGDDDVYPLYPTECREGRKTYAAPMKGVLELQYWDEHSVPHLEEMDVSFGRMPVMVCSSKCNLRGKSESALIGIGEDGNELGGYFISNGNERVLRMLIAERRNRWLSIQRASFTKRQTGYSDLGLLIRCVRDDCHTAINILHYIEDGTATLEVNIGSGIFLIPVVLLFRALKQTTDRNIWRSLLSTLKADRYLSERIELMLRQAQQIERLGSGVRSQRDALSFIGKHFRQYLPQHCALTEDRTVGQSLIDTFIFVHCTTNAQKFDLLAYGLRQLYAFVRGHVLADNLDFTDCQESLVPGQIIASQIGSGLLGFLKSIKMNVSREQFRRKASVRSQLNWTESSVFAEMANPSKYPNAQVGTRMQFFLNTGNLPYKDKTLKQATGWSITADRINMFRFLSHYRAVHRGSFWAGMRSTDVRKLRPESWGFLCPVHTPDGTPCGLLNHLTEPAMVVTRNGFHNEGHRRRFIELCQSLGMLALTFAPERIGSDMICVTLDGVVIGFAHNKLAPGLVATLREWKVKQLNGVPQATEIYFVPDFKLKMYPQIDISTAAGRFLRPVLHLKHDRAIEWISPLEQTLLNIAVTEEEIKAAEISYSHRELSALSILSVLAGLTPMSDCNQSPRNMYQCQMLKQAMGLHAQNVERRTDNKAYRLMTTQSPIMRNTVYEKYEMDDYSAGTNAVVAVVSYTGYDMEDAMIICKESMERGFKHGCVYVTQAVDLREHKIATEDGSMAPYLHFKNVGADGVRHVAHLSDMGLPLPGTKLEAGTELYCLWDHVSRKFVTTKYKKKEGCVVSQVRVIAEDGAGETQLVSIKLRYWRCPVIGDKFASRAGQKGTMSQLWPQRDMPFTDSGIVPDLIINPHAFPSRMTIGMLLESMAAKCGALMGKHFDASPFQYTEKSMAVDYFGKLLRQRGMDYYGSEAMYCGLNGALMQADIYIGLVYYQRLRHMISDKYQVRAVGPVNALTRQPLKGRKRGGGIRLGEMERDAVLAHGCAFLLHDRLFSCSDGELRWLCRKCKTHLSVHFCPQRRRNVCRLCESTEQLTRVNLPHVFTYLSNELAAMNIRLTLTTAS